MSSVRIYTYLQTEVDGQTIEFGSLSTPRSITFADGDAIVKRFSVAASTAQILFDVDNDLADFDFLLLASDLDVTAQFVVDEDNNVGIEQFTLPIAGSGVANTYGVPLILGDDDAYANYTIDFGGGTLDVIEKVSVKNLSGSATANVILIVGT